MKPFRPFDLNFVPAFAPRGNQLDKTGDKKRLICQTRIGQHSTCTYANMRVKYGS
jgi:hypothetical protein